MIISSRPGDKGYSPYYRHAIKHVMFNGIDIKHMVHYVNTWLGICKKYKTWPWHEYVWADGSWPAYGSWSKDAFPPLEVCTMHATTLDVVFNDGWTWSSRFACICRVDDLAAPIGRTATHYILDECHTHRPCQN